MVGVTGVDAVAGDVVFYRGKRGSLFDGVIELVEHGGDIVHCEMVVSATQSIGALSSGVTKHAIPAGGIVARTGAKLDALRRHLMLTWLEGQVGKPYGWEDCLVAAEATVAPHGPFVVSGSGAMDCSHLVTAALQIGGYPLPAALAIEHLVPATVTPEELFEALADVVDVEE
jgi:hypothetical protein